VPWLAILMRLTKIRIAVLATATAVAGYLLVRPELSLALVSVTGGVLLLAMGASALNEWQERELDASMARTRTRPLPSGALTPRAGLTIAICLIGSGLFLLAHAHGAIPASFGAATVFWYNAVYTPLKRRTAFAAVPGGLIGAAVPLIGWTAAGGTLLDPRVVALATFFFLWQVPHFWLLLLRCGDEYAAAGLPSLSRLLGARGLGRVTFVWMTTTAGAAPLFALYGLTHSAWTAVLLLVAGALLVRAGFLLLRPQTLASSRVALYGINGYVCVVIVLVVVDAMRAASAAP
jgi:heme o synthase